MIDELRTILAAAIAPAAAHRDLVKRIGRCESRVSLLVQDLDCDIDGSLAADVGALRDEISALSARVDEWIPTAAENSARREGLR